MNYGANKILALWREILIKINALIVVVCFSFSANQDETTALHFAAKAGDLEMVDLLLNSGCQVNAKDAYGFTPLMLACKQGYLAVVDRLLGHPDCDVNLTNNLGETALMYTTKDRTFRPTESCALSLLQAGADVNIKNHQECTALLMATVFRKPSIGRLLLSQGGPHVHARGTLSFLLNFRTVEMTVSPLEAAYFTGNFELCRILVAAGADTNVLLKFLTGRQSLVMQVVYDTGVSTNNRILISIPAVPEWLRDRIQTPRSLMDLCRTAIRNCCSSRNSKDAVRCLCLPSLIEEYLAVPELLMTDPM